jgi:hypothetical protein
MKLQKLLKSFKILVIAENPKSANALHNFNNKYEYGKSITLCSYSSPLINSFEYVFSTLYHNF